MIGALQVVTLTAQLLKSTPLEEGRCFKNGDDTFSKITRNEYFLRSLSKIHYKYADALGGVGDRERWDDDFAEKYHTEVDCDKFDLRVAKYNIRSQQSDIDDLRQMVNAVYGSGK